MRIGGLSRWASVVLLGLAVMALSGLGNGGQPPVADFSWEFLTETVVQFHDESYDPDGQIVAWRWDFGDGYTSTQQNPSHAYEQEGVYTITLTVTDNDGLSSTASKRIGIGRQLQPPVADFSWELLAGRVVQFHDESHDPDGQIVSWEWDFGDGEASKEQNPQHTYGQPGTYEVSLTVTDNDGLTSAVSKELVIPDCLVPDDYPTIGEALAAVPAGGLIALKAGTYKENLEIITPVTLLGAGAGKTVIRAAEWFQPVITIESDQPIEVQLEGVTVGRSHYGLLIRGQARVTISNAEVSGNDSRGLDVSDLAQVTVENCTISGNYNGLVVSDQAQVTVEKSTISGSGDGLSVGGSARVTVGDCTISGNRGSGLWVHDSAQVTVENSTFSGNSSGLHMENQARMELNGSWVSDNHIGIYREDSATITGKDNWVRYNIEDFEGFTPPEDFLGGTPPEPLFDEAEVGPQARFQDIWSAIAHTKPGGTVRIQAGEYRGPIAVSYTHLTLPTKA